MNENADSKSKACCPYPPAPPVDRITAVEERMTLMENRMTNLEKRMTNLELHVYPIA